MDISNSYDSDDSEDSEDSDNTEDGNDDEANEISDEADQNIQNQLMLDNQNLSDSESDDEADIKDINQKFLQNQDLDDTDSDSENEDTNNDDDHHQDTKREGDSNNIEIDRKPVEKVPSSPRDDSTLDRKIDEEINNLKMIVSVSENTKQVHHYVLFGSAIEVDNSILNVI